MLTIKYSRMFYSRQLEEECIPIDKCDKNNKSSCSQVPVRVNMVYVSWFMHHVFATLMVNTSQKGGSYHEKCIVGYPEILFPQSYPASTVTTKPDAGSSGGSLVYGYPLLCLSGTWRDMLQHSYIGAVPDLLLPRSCQVPEGAPHGLTDHSQSRRLIIRSINVKSRRREAVTAPPSGGSLSFSHRPLIIFKLFIRDLLQVCYSLVPDAEQPFV